MKFLRIGLLAASLTILAMIHLACEVDSSNTFSRDVAVDFSGHYTGCDGGAIVYGISGNSISSLNLRQSGDSLEAIDSNGGIWRGTLGEVQNNRSSFDMKGVTTAGAEAWFSGTISTDGSKGRMSGTFIEGDRYRPFCAEANDVTPPSPPPDNGGSSTNNHGGATNTNSSSASIIMPTSGAGSIANGYVKIIQRLLEPAS